MCLIIRNNEISNALYVANEDIKCYKRFNIERGKLYSAFRAFEYNLNKLYKEPKMIIPPQIVNGRYQFKPKLKYFYNPTKRAIASIERGFHSYSSLKVVNRRQCCNEKIFLCIIPKGSEFYYDNVDKEYCSNQIIIKKQIG